MRVRSVELIEHHEATNAHARLRVEYDEPAGCPSQLFCKLLPAEPSRRDAIVATGMGLREARFYETLADRLSLRTPRVYAALSDARGGFLLLLEDLPSSGCTVSDGPTSVAVDSAAAALEDLAQMHLRFADPARRRAEAGWVEPSPPPSDYGVVRLRFALDHHRARLSPAFAEIAELYVRHPRALHALWAGEPETVVHGDAHIGNLFDDAGRTGFLDWGLIHRGHGLRDVSYFLAMALSVEDRRARERHLLQHYLGAWRAGGGEPIALDAAWHEHRVLAAYLVPACCQIVTFPDDLSPRRSLFSAAFLARAEAAIEDLDVRAALEGSIG